MAKLSETEIAELAAQVTQVFTEAQRILEFMGAVVPAVDETIHSLAEKKFKTDPIGGAKYSRMTSIVSSAYKRHGRIIETALFESLSRANHLQAWQEGGFKVSMLADFTAQSGLSLDYTAMDYGDEKRAVRIDLVTFDSTDQTIRAYEVKRGFGFHDSGKLRQLRHDLMCVQLLLKSYGESLGLKPTGAHAFIVSYYGTVEIPRPWTLTGDELDQHFGHPVSAHIDAANLYFQSKLHDLLEKQQ